MRFINGVSRLRRTGLSLTLLAGLTGLSGPAHAVDSLFTWNDAPFFKLYHAYSANDGFTHIEEISVPQQMLGGSTSNATGLFELREPQMVRVAKAPDGSMIDWHYATDSRHLIIPIQGDTVFDIGDGKIYHVKPGEAILAEDWTGKGHRSGCMATNKKFCLVFDMTLGPNPKALPLQPPPKQ